MVVPYIVSPSNLYIYYVSVIWVPLYFICYAILHIFRHKRDGQEGGIIKYSRIYKLKQNLLAVLVLVCVGNAGIEVYYIISGAYQSFGDYLRPTFYILAALAWGFCLYLVRFDFKRRLKMGHFGQKTFWALNVPLFAIDIFVSNNQGISDLAIIIRVAFYALAALLCIKLTSIACYRPDDFGKTADLLYDPIRSLLGSEHAPSISEHVTKVEILDYKIKSEGGKSVVFYNIQVTIYDSKYVIKRTSAAIEGLAKTIEDRVLVDHIQGLSTPQFPELTKRESSIDKIIEHLELFMKEVVKPVFMFDEICDFFEIPATLREHISSEQHSLIQFFRESTESRTSLFSRPSSSRTTVQHTPNQRFFLISVAQFTDAGDHIEYTVQWTSVRTALVGKCVYRYSEMLTFHKQLKSVLGAVTLPEFPSKHHLSFMSVTTKQEAIDERMLSLSKYYEELCNDPAYLCDALLKFIKCEVPLEVIWTSAIQGVFYKLDGPLSWERHFELEPKPFVNYVFTVVKYEETGHVKSWVVVRRYSQFQAFHVKLRGRSQSPVLKGYLRFLKVDESLSTQVPTVPGKSIKQLHDAQQIESRKDDLQKFMEKCVGLRHITDSYCFKAFIEDRE
jgi:hypothetical protein